MSDIRLTVDGSPHVVAAGTTVGKVFFDLTIDAVVARANGDALKDLAWVPDDGDIVESVPMDTEEGRAVLRHSCAHVLAQAVQDLFPEAKLGIGPPITNGFYYDFDVPPPVTPAAPPTPHCFYCAFGAPRPSPPDAREKIGARMRKIVKEGQRSARRVVADDD